MEWTIAGNLYDASNVIETFGNSYDGYASVNSGIEEGDSNYYYLYADLKSKKKLYTNKKNIQSGRTGREY